MLASKLVSGLSVSTGIAFFALRTGLALLALCSGLALFALCAGLTLFALCAGLALFALFSYKRCEPILQRTVKAGRESKLICRLSVGTDCPGVALITLVAFFALSADRSGFTDKGCKPLSLCTCISVIAGKLICRLSVYAVNAVFAIDTVLTVDTILAVNTILAVCTVFTVCAGERLKPLRKSADIAVVASELVGRSAVYTVTPCGSGCGSADERCEPVGLAALIAVSDCKLISGFSVCTVGSVNTYK